MSRHSSYVRAIAAAMALMPVMIAAQPAKTAFVPADLIRSEATSFGSFATRLSDYDASVRQARVSKSTTVSQQLKSQADQIKSASQVAQRDLRAVIDKLQRANKWTPDFDAFVIDRMKANGVDARVITMVQSEGGARALLTSAAAGLPTLPQDVDQDLKAIAPKGVGWLPRLGVGETVYAGKGKCAIFVAAGVVLLAIDAIPGAGFAFGKAIDCVMTS